MSLDDSLAALQELFPNCSQSYLSSLLEQNDNDLPTVVNIVVSNNQADELCSQLAEIFPDESVETLLDLVHANENASLQELIEAYCLQCTSDSVSRHAPTSARLKRKPLYKASIQDLQELEYNLTGTVLSNLVSHPPLVTCQPTNMAQESILSQQLGGERDSRYYRNLATHYHDCMAEHFQRAQKSYTRHAAFGPGTASFLSDEGYKYQRLMREASKKAALCIFLEKNPEWPSNAATVDLHNLTVEEAVQIATEILETRTKNITFITGKGCHSVGGSKLKPALIQLGKRMSLKVEILESAVRLYK